MQVAGLPLQDISDPANLAKPAPGRGVCLRMSDNDRGLVGTVEIGDNRIKIVVGELALGSVIAAAEDLFPLSYLHGLLLKKVY